MCRSHSFMMASPEAVRTRSPLIWTALTGPRWPCRTRYSLPVARSQTCVFVSCSKRCDRQHAATQIVAESEMNAPWSS